ncbi:Uma2 family endonuclease [Streptomyces sp. NPDC052077]|uniref:Uma2 family endonuclease n=1 Tax=Streptomyces sp. NPDC052077 TaxID=3154757 RepID=UPI00341E2290
MSAASVEPPHTPRPLITLAHRLMDREPGLRAEIVGNQILATPPPDGPHAVVLTDLMLPLAAAGLHGPDTKIVQGVGLWLPTGTEDYAVPDLAVVDADFAEHLVEFNSYDPVCFRMVLEVTSSNHGSDLRTKVAAYAAAKIPVYVIVNRRHERLHVLTDPAAGDYATHRVHSPGERVTLPGFLGAEVVLDVSAVLAAGRPNPAPDDD